MTALSFYARLVRMTDNTVLASTTNITRGSIQRVLDKPGARSLTVPLGDPGAGTGTASGFANALLAAVGGPDLASAPVPTLLEFSFDGGTTIDARWMVEKVTPDLSSGQLLITCDGDDSGSLYNTIGPDRFPVQNVALADALGGTTGNIIPLSSTHYGISTNGKIPGLQGLLRFIPGNEPASSPMWATAAQTRITLTGVISNALASAIAFLGVNIDAWEDTTGRLLTSLVKILGGVVFPTDTADQGSRGHVVWCDSDVNLSGDIAGVVCDGTPTSGSPAGANGYSNDATNHPTGIPRALVVGNVGGNPRGHAFTFDGTSTASLAPSAEASTARLYADQTLLQPDLSPLYSEILLTGGTNDAGLLPSETITSLISLNNIPADTPKVAWTNVLPILGTNLSDTTGGIYFYAGDGRLRRIPSWTLGLPVLDLTVNNIDGVIYAATPQGVFSHTTAGLATSTTPWARVGGLTFKVNRLIGVAVTTHFYLYALVSGVGQAQDGVYHYDHDTPSTQTGAGYDHWTRFLPLEKLLSITATDDHSCFFITPADQQANLHYFDATDTSTPFHTWSLGAGVQGVRLDRVLTAAGQDSVWIATSGATQPGQYLLYSSGWVGQTLQPIDKMPGTAGSALDDAVGVATGLAVEPQINRAIPLGYGINGVTVAVLLCTNVGVYYMAGSIPTTGGVGWSAQGNGQNGLAGIAITNLVVGQPTQVPSPHDPTTYVSASRMYAISGTVFFASWLESYYWRDVLREPLTLAPFFYDLAATVLGDLPSFAVQTIGPMASSPIGRPTGSHVQVATCLPAGWYWRRRWNECYEPYYSLVNSNVLFPSTYKEQITEAAVTPSVDIASASDEVATFAIMLAGEHAAKQATLTVHSGFTQQESGLRYLWPTHQVAVSQTGVIKALSSTGHAIDTTYINLSAAAFYVLSHTISWDGPQVSTVTELGTTVRGTPQTGADLAAALVQDLRRIRVKGLRTKR